ncbi:MFS transporter [Desulfitobacterium sp.]|uniref:MFS transporter n=1 Tax=Desulfitobacterium sp. TaxID=49981 RepID=UPI002B1FBC32|nr:MFS transporter [Desulfitobacterium sp.]MEA4901584.1 MFS transporter [Desulfitobacterium sp.]
MQKKTRILLWMVIAMIISYLPWYNFSAVLKYISKEFHLTASDTGMIIAAFQTGYVIVVIFTGWLADRIGTKRVVLYATLFTGIFSTAFVFVVHDLTTVMIMRLLTGCAAGAIYVPGMALISNWFAPHERGGALGAYTAALTVASAGGYFVAAPIAASAGWRTGMLWTSVPVFIAFFIVWFLVDEKPTEKLQFDGAPAIKTSIPGGVRQCPEGGYAGPAIITAGYMGHMWELYAFWGWLGPFMVANATAAGMAASAAVKWGGLLAACITLAGAPAVWLMGMLADKIGRTKAIIISATCSLVAEFFIGSLVGKSLTAVVLVGIWIGFWVISDSAIYKAGLTDMVTPQKRSTLLGIQSAIGYSMTIIAPIVFGKILQAYNGPIDPTEMRVWAPAFIALGIGAIVAPVAAFILRKVPQAKLMADGKM